MIHYAIEQELLLRRKLLAAAGQHTGIAAGLENDRVLTMSMMDRERLIVIHQLTADLLGGNVERLVSRLTRTGYFDLQLAVLRGTVLSHALAMEVEAVAPAEPPAVVTAALDLMPSGAKDRVIRGYHAYLDVVWQAPDRYQIPIVDLVVRLLMGVDLVEIRGVALAGAAVHKAHLMATMTPVEDLYHEQLALMTAFLGAEAVSFRDGHLMIPHV